MNLGVLHPSPAAVRLSPSSSWIPSGIPSTEHQGDCSQLHACIQNSRLHQVHSLVTPKYYMWLSMGPGNAVVGLVLQATMCPHCHWWFPRPLGAGCITLVVQPLHVLGSAPYAPVGITHDVTRDQRGCCLLLAAHNTSGHGAHRSGVDACAYHHSVGVTAYVLTVSTSCTGILLQHESAIS